MNPRRYSTMDCLDGRHENCGNNNAECECRCHQQEDIVHAYEELLQAAKYASQFVDNSDAREYLERAIANTNFLKNEGAETLSKQQGDSHGAQSGQA